MFELADDEFKEIRNQRADLRANAQKSIARGDKEIALTVESLSAFIERWPGAAALVASASAAGFDFNEDIEEEGSYVSDPYILARKIGIDTVDKFEEALSTDISDYLKKLFVADGKATSWIATLPFLIILVLVNHKPSNVTIEDLVSIGFSKDIAEDVVRIAQE